ARRGPARRGRRGRAAAPQRQRRASARAGLAGGGGGRAAAEQRPPAVGARARRGRRRGRGQRLRRRPAARHARDAGGDDPRVRDGAALGAGVGDGGHAALAVPDAAAAAARAARAAPAAHGADGDAAAAGGRATAQVLGHRHRRAPLLPAALHAALRPLLAALPLLHHGRHPGQGGAPARHAPRPRARRLAQPRTQGHTRLLLNKHCKTKYMTDYNIHLLLRLYSP
ncbi:Protein of unknown function, partial [Gryllus bimaculatus]